jgi:hypothetical protein
MAALMNAQTSTQGMMAALSGTGSKFAGINSPFLYSAALRFGRQVARFNAKAPESFHAGNQGPDSSAHDE